MLDCIDILHNCIVLSVHHKHWIDSCNTVDNLIANVSATINWLVCSNNRLACFFFIFFSQIEQAQHSIKTAAHELCWNMWIKSHTSDFFTMSFVKFISLFHSSKIPKKLNDKLTAPFINNSHQNTIPPSSAPARMCLDFEIE